jgi:hypothetical protein
MKKILFICLFICLFIFSNARAKVFCEPWDLVNKKDSQPISLVFHGKMISSHSIIFKTNILDENKASREILQKIKFKVIDIKKGTYNKKYINVYSSDDMLEIDTLKELYGEELIVKVSKFNEFKFPKISQKDLGDFNIKFIKNIEEEYWIPGHFCQKYQFEKIKKQS